MIINKKESINNKSYKNNLKLDLRPVGNNVKISTVLEQRCRQDYIEKRSKEVHKETIEYIKKVKNADKALFDETFVDLFRSGILEIEKTGKEYQINHLFLEKGNQNNKEVVHLISIDNKTDIDILTEDKMNGFERKKFMGFKLSQCFYEIYKKCQKSKSIKENKITITNDIYDEICEMILNHNDKMHKNVPETYYGKI
jgi:hypothetical protein